jgi:hypothetical protein
LKLSAVSFQLFCFDFVPTMKFCTVGAGCFFAAEDGAQGYADRNANRQPDTDVSGDRSERCADAGSEGDTES